LSIPFTIEWSFHRGADHFYLYYREAYQYGGAGPTPGPQPGVAKLALTVGGRSWIGAIGLDSVFTAEGLIDVERIGYVR
jgi:hypothetical protein